LLRRRHAVVPRSTTIAGDFFCFAASVRFPIVFWRQPGWALRAGNTVSVSLHKRLVAIVAADAAQLVNAAVVSACLLRGTADRGRAAVAPIGEYEQVVPGAVLAVLAAGGAGCLGALGGAMHVLQTGDVQNWPLAGQMLRPGPPAPDSAARASRCQPI